MPRLVVEKGPDKGKAIALPARGTLLVGRDSSAGLQLRDGMMSRLHFKIEAREDGFWLHDLESLNGTLLNGNPVREARLTFGDLVGAGETFLSFVSDEAAAVAIEGQRIGGYRILERVGRGGMGTVYKAEQIDLQRIVALKVMSEEHCRDKEFIELFIHEARAAAKLNHPNIVQVYDVKRHQNLYYISMEFVGGGSVQEILNRQRKLPVDEAVRIVLDAARGLEYAHQKGIIHRDVKPDNLFLSETGACKIGDMGLARGLNEKVGPEEETSVIGTPHYIAPEQVLGRPADFRSDIYSLGATAYRMIGGVTPHSAPSIRDLVNRKVREDPVPLHELNAEVPRSLGQIVARMMARDPDQRTATMAQAIAELERFQREQAGLSLEARREHTTALETLAGNRKLLLAASGLLVLVAGLVFTGAVFFRDPPPPPPDPAEARRSDEERARQALSLWELRELKDMDRRDRRSIQRVIEGYRSVMEEFPRTPQAARARELRGKLLELLRQVTAEARLELLEADDVSNFNKTFRPFQPRRLDLGLVETTIHAYRSFADNDEYRGTPAAEQAARRADHIREWKRRLEGRREEFLRISAWGRTFAEERRFKEAVQALEAFRRETREMEVPCDFAPDRYVGFFYDEAAAAEAQALLAQAQEYWADVVERSALRLADENRFEEAVGLLEPVVAQYPDEIAAKARELRVEIEALWTEHTRRMVEEREREREALLARAREEFERASESAYQAFLRMDFKGALQRMIAARDAIAAEDFRPRLDRRVSELERAVHLKETLINVINARDARGGNPYGFKREFRRLGLDGTIESADDRSLKVLLRSGGTYDWLWSQFDAQSFVDFVRTQWKYSAVQRADAKDQCDLAVVWMELGLYEEALAELAVAMRSAAYATNPALRRFVDEYKERIEKGETAQSEEIEAQKRLARLDRFVALNDPASARAELEVLRTRFGKTRAFAAAQKKIADHEQRIKRGETEEDRRSLREQTWRRIQTRTGEVQTAARRAQTDVIARLGRIEDPFERNAHLGAVYAAAADWERSTGRYVEARRAGDMLAARAGAGREILPALAGVYMALGRNYIIVRDKPKVEQLRAEADRRFALPEGGEEPTWTRLKAWLAAWERAYPEQERRAAMLREEVRAQPEDPEKIWSLAVVLMDGLQAMVEARGWLAYLQDSHPDFVQVQNGNCLYRLAESYFAAREMRDAANLYKDLTLSHPNHPKVLDEAAPDRVAKRMSDAWQVLTRMGLPRDR